MSYLNLDVSKTKLNQAEISRYSRHLILPNVGVEGQKKLKSASVLMIGAGGLGSPLALYLAAAGVGRLGLVDYDIVDESNLQRQVLYSTDDVNTPKIEAAKKRILGSNPDAQVDLYQEPLNADNALDIFAPYDVVVDGTDNFPTRYLVNDACVLLGKPNVYGSIYRFEGQLSIFGLDDGPCYRCLYPEPPPPGLVPSCAEGGVLGILPGIIGTMQATETVKLILGIGEPMKNRLLLFDALGMEFNELNLQKNPTCAVCGDSPTVTELIDYEQFCQMPAHDHSLYVNPDEKDDDAMEVPQITPKELKARLDNGDKLQILDVREPHEWEISNLEAYGSVLIPKGEVLDRVSELDPNKETIVQCRTGGRSAAVLKELAPLGFEKIWNLDGGINLWAEEVDSDMATY